MAKPASDLPSGFDVRETADDGTAAGATTRTFTEGEAYALVADNVQRETAAKQAEIEQLKSEKAELSTKVETADAALATEKARADKAEADLKVFTETVESEKAAAARTDERVALVKETAKHLAEDFFTPERAARWALMETEAFDAYIKELADLSAGIPAATKDGKATTDDGKPPRETAAAGTSVAGAPKTSAGLAGFWGISDGAPKGGN